MKTATALLPLIARYMQKLADIILQSNYLPMD